MPLINGLVIHYFKKAYKFENDNIDYIKSLAYAEFKVGNLVSSIELYSKGLSIAPNDIDLSLDFSLIYYESGDVNRSISIIKDAINENQEESLLYYRLVIYLMDAGKYKESINVLESALSLNFDNHEVLFDFVPNFESQSALIRIINNYKNNLNEFQSKNIPKSDKKARDEGITMVIDKGSSIQQCKDLIESSSKYIDFVKFDGQHQILQKI